MTFPRELDEYLDKCVSLRDFDFDAVSEDLMAGALGFLRHPFANEPDGMVRLRAEEVFSATALRSHWEARLGTWEVVEDAEWEVVGEAVAAGSELQTDGKQPVLELGGGSEETMDELHDFYTYDTDGEDESLGCTPLSREQARAVATAAASSPHGEESTAAISDGCGSAQEFQVQAFFQDAMAASSDESGSEGEAATYHELLRRSARRAGTPAELFGP